MGFSGLIGGIQMNLVIFCIAVLSAVPAFAQTTIYAEGAPISTEVGSEFTMNYSFGAMPLARNYTVFAQFVNSAGAIVFADSYFPSPGTSVWTGATMVSRRLTVPATVAPGKYSIVVGLYYPPTGERVGLVTGLGVTQFGYLDYNIGNLMVSAAVSVTAPAPAVTAGFTTLAANYDFTKPMAADWLDCYPNDGKSHQFWAGYWYRTDIPPCNQSINLVNDKVAGSQVLDMTWKPSFYGMDQGYTEIQTASHDGSLATDFPPNVYFETTYRVETTPNINLLNWADVGGSFWGIYTWPTVGIAKQLPGLETDITEDHGDFPSYVTGGGYFNWAAGGCPNCGGFGGVSGFDPRQYHTAGLLVTSDGSTSMAVCGYLDGIPHGCRNVLKPTVGDFSYRNFLILINGIGCNYYAGDNSCLNATITNVYACPAPNAGKICISPRTSSLSWNGAGHWIVEAQNNPTVMISGVNGVPGANGVFTMTFSGTYNGDWVLNGTTFSGAYTGGGELNQYTQTDMYVKNARVWSCAGWSSGLCNRSVITIAP